MWATVHNIQLYEMKFQNILNYETITCQIFVSNFLFNPYFILVYWQIPERDRQHELHVNNWRAAQYQVYVNKGKMLHKLQSN